MCLCLGGVFAIQRRVLVVQNNHRPHHQSLHRTPTAKRTEWNTVVGRADNILVDLQCIFDIINDSVTRKEKTDETLLAYDLIS